MMLIYILFGGDIMKYLKHYRAAYGFIPSIIFSLVSIALAVIGNDLWIISVTLSLVLQIFGVTKARKYYDQLEVNIK
jgi:hypothetical protein